MTRSPLISIITPSYNSGKYIERAIQSVLNQEYKKGSTSSWTVAVRMVRAFLELKSKS